MQLSDEQRDQKMMEIQDEMTSIVAAAVHKGWISVAECILDSLDGDTYLEQRQRAKYQSLPTERLWSRWLAEQYLDPTLPGKSHFETAFL